MPHDQPKGLDARHGARPHDPDERPSDDVNDPGHYRMSAADKAHGTRGKGDAEEVLSDPQATDTGDDAQLRRTGARDEPPSPERMRENSTGRMGGAGWGSEQVGGSSVDRRPPDQTTGDDRRHA